MSTAPSLKLKLFQITYPLLSLFLCSFWTTSLNILALSVQVSLKADSFLNDLHITFGESGVMSELCLFALINSNLGIMFVLTVLILHSEEFLWFFKTSYPPIVSYFRTKTMVWYFTVDFICRRIAWLGSMHHLRTDRKSSLFYFSFYTFTNSNSFSRFRSRRHSWARTITGSYHIIYSWFVVDFWPWHWIAMLSSWKLNIIFTIWIHSLY